MQELIAAWQDWMWGLVAILAAMLVEPAKDTL